MTITELPSSFIGEIGTYLLNTERARSSSACKAFKRSLDISNRLQLNEQTNFLNQFRTIPNMSLVSQSTLSNRSWKKWLVRQPSHQAVHEQREKIVRLISQDLHVFDRKALLEEDFLDWVDVDHSDLWSIDKMKEIVNGIAEKKDDILISFFEKLAQFGANQNARTFLQKLPADITLKEKANEIREWLKAHGSEVTLSRTDLGNDFLPVEIIYIPTDRITTIDLISRSIESDHHELFKALLFKNLTPIPIDDILEGMTWGGFFTNPPIKNPEFFRTFAQYANADDHKLDNIVANDVKILMETAGRFSDLESFNCLIKAFKRGGHQRKLLRSGKLSDVDLMFEDLIKRKVPYQLIEAVWNFYQEFPDSSMLRSELINAWRVAAKHKNCKLMNLIERRLGRAGRWGKVAAVINYANHRLLGIPGKEALAATAGVATGIVIAAGAAIMAEAAALGAGRITGVVAGIGAIAGEVYAAKATIPTRTEVAGTITGAALRVATIVGGGLSAVTTTVIAAITAINVLEKETAEVAAFLLSGAALPTTVAATAVAVQILEQRSVYRNYEKKADRAVNALVSMLWAKN